MFSLATKKSVATSNIPMDTVGSLYYSKKMVCHSGMALGCISVPGMLSGLLFPIVPMHGISLVFQIPCEDRCLDPQTPPETAFRGSKYLLTGYLGFWKTRVLSYIYHTNHPNVSFHIPYIASYGLGSW